MTVVAFTPRTPAPTDRRFKVLLAKGSARRLYQILPAGHDRWQCWIRANGKAYLSTCTDEIAHLDRIAVEFAADVAALKADGWSEL